MVLSYQQTLRRKGICEGRGEAFPLACGKELIYSRTRNRALERRKKSEDMNSITASQLKTEGIAAIEKQLAIHCETVITVQGKEKFVVMDMQRYNYLQKCELLSRSNATALKISKTFDHHVST